MRPGRFHGELAPLVSSREEGALPHLDVLWHYECVVSPRSPTISPASHAAKRHAGALSPRSPLQAAGLLSPSSSAASPISPRSPSPACMSAPTAGLCGYISPCSPGAINSSTATTAMGSISFQSREDQHHGALQRVFNTFDEDGDGHVSVDELCGIFEKLGIPKSPDSIQSLLAGLPRGHIGSVDEEEFILLYDSVCSCVDKLDADTSSSDDMDADVDEDLRAAFHVFDLDGNGFISPEELQCVLCSLGFPKAHQLDACVDMIARVDENGDGQVDFSEFKKLMGWASAAMILSC